MDEDGKKSLEKFLGYIIGFFIECWLVMLLWNWLMPIIGLQVQLTYWQSFGLLVLCTYLFKNQRLD